MDAGRGISFIHSATHTQNGTSLNESEESERIGTNRNEFAATELDKRKSCYPR